MKFKLNVRVNLTKEVRFFTVWPKPHQYLPGLEFYTGQGASIAEAVEDLLARMPEEFTFDDEISVRTTSLEPVLHRPFEIVRSNRVRVFLLS